MRLSRRNPRDPFHFLPCTCSIHVAARAGYGHEAAKAAENFAEHLMQTEGLCRRFRNCSNFAAGFRIEIYQPAMIGYPGCLTRGINADYRNAFFYLGLRNDSPAMALREVWLCWPI